MWGERKLWRDRAAAFIGRFGLREVLVACAAIGAGLLALRQPTESPLSAAQPNHPWIEVFVGAFLVVWYWRLWQADLRAKALILFAAVQSLGCFWLRSSFPIRDWFSSEAGPLFVSVSEIIDFGIWSPVILTALPLRVPETSGRPFIRGFSTIVVYALAAGWIVWLAAESMQLPVLIQTAIDGLLAKQPYRLGNDVVYVYVSHEETNNRILSVAGRATLVALGSLAGVWTLLLVAVRRPRTGWCVIVVVASLASATVVALLRQSLELMETSSPLLFIEWRIPWRLWMVCGGLLVVTMFWLSLRRLSMVETAESTVFPRRAYFPGLFGLFVVALKWVEHFDFFQWLSHSFGFSYVVSWLTIHRGPLLAAATTGLVLHLREFRGGKIVRLSAQQPPLVPLQSAFASAILTALLIQLVVASALFGFALFIARDSPLDFIIRRGP